MGDVVYIHVRPEGDGFVYEVRDSEHEAVETSDVFSTAEEAAQAGADAHPSGPDAGVEVRHALVNDGEPEYGDDEPFKLAEAEEPDDSIAVAE